MLSHILTVAACLLASTNAFVVTPSAAALRCSKTGSGVGSMSTRPGGSEAGGGLSMKWDGKSIPKKNDMFHQIPEDTRAWEVEGAREDVWEDKPNPTPETNWWKAFLPSEEEIEAAAQGFDFSNPEQWLAENTK